MYAKTTLSTYLEALHTSYDFCENVFSKFFLSTLYIPPLGGCRKKKKNTLRRINSAKEKSKKLQNFDTKPNLQTSTRRQRKRKSIKAKQNNTRRQSTHAASKHRKTHDICERSICIILPKSASKETKMRQIYHL